MQIHRRRPGGRGRHPVHGQGDRPGSRPGQPALPLGRHRRHRVSRTAASHEQEGVWGSGVVVPPCIAALRRRAKSSTGLVRLAGPKAGPRGRPGTRRGVTALRALRAEEQGKGSVGCGWASPTVAHLLSYPLAVSLAPSALRSGCVATVWPRKTPHEEFRVRKANRFDLAPWSQ